MLNIFKTDPETKCRPYNGDKKVFDSPHFKDHLLFYEYFGGDDGRGIGASHQTGWTALIARVVSDLYSVLESGCSRQDIKS